MRIRTFIVIVVLLGLIYAVGTVFETNRELLGQQLVFGKGVSLDVGRTLVVFLFLGAAVTFLLGLSRQFGVMIERSRLRKASRKSEQIEEEYSRGLVDLLEGRDEEALGHFRAVLERDSRHFNTLLKLGDILRSQEKYAEAIEYHRKAYHLKGDNTRPLYALVDDYEAKGDMERARSVLGKIIGINKNSVVAWRKLRSLHMKERNWKKALEAHEKVEKLADPGDPRDAADRRFGLGIRYEMAAERLESGKRREAIGILRRVLKENEQFIPAHVLLGTASLQDGQESEAVRTWCQGFEATGSPIFLTTLEEHYLEREQPLQAIETLKRCVAQARKDTLPRFYLGKLYFRLEMLDDALSALSALEGVATYAPTLHYLVGRIHERRNNYDGAAREYRKVIKEMDLVQLEYRCRSCGDTAMEWTPRCAPCGEWNTIEVNFREEIPLEELGLAPAPIYTSRS
jgi:lipopolysaccharide biosynthesis regulator YciM